MVDNSTNKGGKIILKNGGTEYNRVVCIENTGDLEVEKVNIEITDSYCCGIYNKDAGKIYLDGEEINFKNSK